MNRNDNDGAPASNTDDSSQSGVASQHKDSLPAALEKDITRREGAVIDDEAVVLSREKSAMAREGAAHVRENASDLREDAAHLRERAAQAREAEANAREGAVTSREREIRAAETQAASDDHVIMLQQANAHLVTATIEAHKLTEQVQTAKDQLDHLAHHDVLTDLPNRVLLQDRLSQAIELARRQGRQFAVMFMDLDQFKHINDSLGHVVGDQLLLSVAQRLVSCVRHSDTISRQGGDEFVLLLPYIERAEDAALSAQKMLAALALPHRIDQHDLHIGASIGISVYPDDGQDAETLIKNADTAMYSAKESGRNNYKFFEQSMNARAVQRQSVEVSLRRALERQEFVLHYQPKINLQSGTIVGVEALIRWQHPERGLLLPAQFVPIAEDCGLILPIGRWVLREACRQVQVWLDSGLRAVPVAVNISAVEFRHKSFLEAVALILKETDLAPRYLELELTESVLMHDADDSVPVLEALKAMGVRLAIDDFGTGYSSLSYLKRFPIDTLKIDQFFVRDIATNADDATIVRTIIGMGKNLKQRVIAEGVETHEQLAFLRAQQCEEGQGFLFSHPLSVENFALLLVTGIDGMRGDG
ncbi:diguanylate cyclase [Rugosibacter aromaticivorans]|uniref:Diguanylate cyclase n=1 Tax=Rugosibacter aromaticivorans TaxID=1565605 RepID=A0A0C5JBI9_9PROT|nr:EAL domain-containing protein [Rugosibacter aromaticivorans]AJP49225.1 diguanylate cyclase [Rugosibacter aromaticivorans]TBR15860.1 MAG: EAL domain-containing protein [Rugosibacter sp.]